MEFLVIDDHAVLREGLSALLKRREPDCRVLAASDGAQGLDVAERHPDLDAVFLDLEMPGIGGIEAIEAFGARRPDLPIIVLSSSEKPSDVRRALAAGALGYVPKSANSDTLMAALHLVLAGEVYVPPLLLDEPPRPIAGARVRSDPARGLTERQFDALRLLARGLTNKEIALELELSEKTVKIHVGAIFKALGVVNRAQAAEAARREGLA